VELLKIGFWNPDFIGNGGGVPIQWEKVAFRSICSISLSFFAKKLAVAAGILLTL
jgi:hypothetical protein